MLYLARSAELNPTFPLTGALDDVAIYNRARWSPRRSRSSRQAPAPPDPQ